MQQEALKEVALTRMHNMNINRWMTRICVKYGSEVSAFQIYFGKNEKKMLTISTRRKWNQNTPLYCVGNLVPIMNSEFLPRNQ